jgi:thiol-disulfide isomerase/thioredoxin
MKKIVILLFLLVSFFASAQLNRVILDEAKSENILYGECDPSGFRSGEFDKWFSPEYESYKVNSQFFAEGYAVKFDSICVVLGSWCSDSQREVPRFCKIMDDEYFAGTKIRFFAVDGNKKTDVLDTEEYYIQYVPTFIFYYGGNELCRIIETPRTSCLEEDIMDLLSRIQP